MFWPHVGAQPSPRPPDYDVLAWEAPRTYVATTGRFKIRSITSGPCYRYTYVTRVELALLHANQFIVYKDLPHPPSSYLPLSDNPKPGLPSLYLTQCDQLSPKSDTPSVDSGYLTAGQTTSTLAVHDDSDSNGHADKGARHSLRLHSHRKSSRPITYAARSADGSGYNPLFPNMGKAGTAYARTVPPSKPRAPQSLPDPGLVFDTLLKRRSQGAESADDGFVPHPGGVSSLFFSFADLIIHCCFETDHTNWARNKTSSYLDLSPLYGSSQKESDTVRRHDGTGRLYEDVFVDTRVLLMPPSVCALLVLFCRNHNVRIPFIYNGATSHHNYSKSLSQKRSLRSMKTEHTRASLTTMSNARVKTMNCLNAHDLWTAASLCRCVILFNASKGFRALVVDHFERLRWGHSRIAKRRI